MTKKFLYLLAVSFLGLSLVACSASPAVEEEKKDLKLTIYAGLMEDHAVLAAREFEAATGVKTDVVRLSSGEALTRIRAEKENMTASVWYGGPVDGFIAAMTENHQMLKVSQTSSKILMDIGQAFMSVT